MKGLSIVDKNFSDFLFFDFLSALKTKKTDGDRPF